MAHSPLRRGLGTDIRTGAPVRGVHPDDTGGVQVRTDDTLDRYDAAVLALDPGALRGVIAASAELGTAAWRDDIAATTTAPPFPAVTRPVGSLSPTRPPRASVDRARSRNRRHGDPCRTLGAACAAGRYTRCHDG
jgi:hypothetical protein